MGVCVIVTGHVGFVTGVCLIQPYRPGVQVKAVGLLLCLEDDSADLNPVELVAESINSTDLPNPRRTM